MGPSTEPCGIPLITSRQLDDLPFIKMRCFLSESQSSSHLRIFLAMPCDLNFLNNKFIVIKVKQIR